METLTPEEGLILTCLIEELKQYPWLRHALLEALQLTALLEMPVQLDELKRIVMQVLQRQSAFRCASCARRQTLQYISV